MASTSRGLRLILTIFAWASMWFVLGIWQTVVAISNSTKHDISISSSPSTKTISMSHCIYCYTPALSPSHSQRFMRKVGWPGRWIHATLNVRVDWPRCTYFTFKYPAVFLPCWLGPSFGNVLQRASVPRLRLANRTTCIVSPWQAVYGLCMPLDRP